MGDTLYFATNNGTDGTKLWKSDGTHAGTALVRDIGSADAPSGEGERDGEIPAYDPGIVAFHGALYFWGDDGSNMPKVWKSDGTKSGTSLIKSDGPLGDDGNIFTPFGDALYFSGYDEAHGFELWRTDGTASGTCMFRDLNTSANPHNNSSAPEQLTVVHDRLYFLASDGAGFGLWRTDGTESGTVMVPVSGIPSFGSQIQDLTVFHDALYFTVRRKGDTELWRTDDTGTGVHRVKDFGGTSQYTLSEGSFVAIGEFLYFVGSGDTRDTEDDDLWRTDGTESGTVIVKSSIGRGNEVHLMNIHDTLYFMAADGSGAMNLWRYGL